ncbi:hypothetical protein GOODEAATRI_021101 [Goodea atripinnis]|uniref:KID domain-containing protein n=1 Tax=Goodea atripinnis TaxID=208336 RepID=A0ABV0NZ37_9TELE
MDTSVSSQLDSCLNDSVTDGEKDHGEANSSPAASNQVQLCFCEPLGCYKIICRNSTSHSQVKSHKRRECCCPPSAIATVAKLEGDGSVMDTQKRRELLSRRPSCHRRHPRLPAAFAQLGPGSEHSDGSVSEQHAEPLITARRGDHPQEGGQADEKQVGKQQEKMGMEQKGH